MKHKLLSIAILFALIFSSCDNENDILELGADTSKKYELVNLNDFLDANSVLRSSEQKDQIVIKFRDKIAYEETLQSLQVMSKEEQLTWSAQLNEFNSLQEIFDQAMIDVENVDETEASYMAFKEKYDQYLYFPMHGEDMGFYIPMFEREVASIASPNGLVIIGNDVKHLKNITNYTELQTTGQAYYSLDENTPLRATVTARTVDNFIGKEIDFGWTTRGDRKIRAKVGRKSNKLNVNSTSTKPAPQFKMHLKLEVSFRKKTWLGWVNYSSTTKNNMTMIVDPYGSGRKVTTKTHNESGASSHDWTWSDALPWFHIGERDNMGRPIFFTPPITITIDTDYTGFTNDIRWSTTLPVVYFVEY